MCDFYQHSYYITEKLNTEGHMNKQSNLIALTIVLISILFSTQQFYMGITDRESSDNIFTLWMVLFIVLISMWCQKDQSEGEASSNIGFMAFLFWPIVLPYYLLKTRGVEGAVTFVGFTTLYISPNVSWLIGYQFS